MAPSRVEAQRHMERREAPDVAQKVAQQHAELCCLVYSLVTPEGSGSYETCKISVCCPGEVPWSFKHVSAFSPTMTRHVASGEPKCGNLLVQVKPSINRNKLMHCPLAYETTGSLHSAGLKHPRPQIGSIRARPYKRLPIPKPYRKLDL